MRDKGDFLHRLCEGLDIPKEILPGGFALFLSGQDELTLQGKCRILHHERQEIRLLIGKTTLSIQGQRLFCRAFFSERVTVCGRIDSLSFSSGKA